MYTTGQLKVNSGRFKSERDPLVLFHSIFDQDEAPQHYFLVNTKMSIFFSCEHPVTGQNHVKRDVKNSTFKSKRCQPQSSLGQRDFAHIGLVMNKTFKGLLMLLNSVSLSYFTTWHHCNFSFELEKAVCSKVMSTAGVSEKSKVCTGPIFCLEFLSLLLAPYTPSQSSTKEGKTLCKAFLPGIQQTTLPFPEPESNERTLNY